MNGSTKSLNDYSAYVADFSGEPCFFLRVPLSRCGDIVNVQRGGTDFEVGDLGTWPLDVAQNGDVRGRKFSFSGMEVAGQPKSRVTVTVAVKDDKREVAAVLSEDQMARMADQNARALLGALGIVLPKGADAVQTVAEVLPDAVAHSRALAHPEAVGAVAVETTTADGATIVQAAPGASGAEVKGARERSARNAQAR